MRTIVALLVVFLFMSSAQAKSTKVSLNGHCDHGLDKEEAMVEADDLTRLTDPAALKRMIGQYQVIRIRGKKSAKEHLLIRVPNKGVGFVLDQRIGNRDRKHRELYRYLRPYAARLIFRLSAQFRVKFGGSLFITSLIRTCDYQNRLRRSGNQNAVTCEQTSHTAGATIDFHKAIKIRDKGKKLLVGFSQAELAWLRTVFIDLERLGYAQATEEGYQPVFHVMVRRVYANYNPPTTKKK